MSNGERKFKYEILRSKIIFSDFLQVQGFSGVTVDDLKCNVYWVNENGITEGCNQAVLEMLGISMEDYVNRTYRDFSTKFNLEAWVCEKFMSDDRAVLYTGKPSLQIEDPPVYLPDGSVRHFLTSRWPRFNSDHKIIGALGVSYDITELKERQSDLFASTRANVLMVKSKAHDLRNHLLSHNEIVDYLINDPSIISNEALMEKVKLLSLSTPYGVKEAEEIMEIANGKYDVQTTDKVNPYRLLHAVKDRFSASINFKKILCNFEASSRLPNVMVAPVQAVNIIMNGLFDNCVNSVVSEKGRVSISLSMDGMDEMSRSGALRWVLTIKDNGPGFPYKLKSFLECNDGDYNHPVGRHGLVAIKRSIYEALNGSIHVKQNIPNGTVVTVTFNDFSGKNR